MSEPMPSARLAAIRTEVASCPYPASDPDPPDPLHRGWRYAAELLAALDASERLRSPSGNESAQAAPPPPTNDVDVLLAHLPTGIRRVRALREMLAALDVETVPFACADVVEMLKATEDLGACVGLVVQELKRASAEIGALRAAVEGSPVPPTDAEIDAHEAAGGGWRCVVPDARVYCADAMRGAGARSLRETLAAAGFAGMWWALDAHNRPCARPAP